MFTLNTCMLLNTYHDNLCDTYLVVFITVQNHINVVTQILQNKKTYTYWEVMLMKKYLHPQNTPIKFTTCFNCAEKK